MTYEQEKKRPKRQQKKPKQEYKKAERGRKFNPWVYRYFNMTVDSKEDKDA